MVDTAIGLAFVFALSALLCSGIVDYGATLLHKKGKYLIRGLGDLLGAADPTVTGWRTRVSQVTVGASLERPLYDKALTAVPDPGASGSSTSVSVDDLMRHPLVDVLKSTSASGKRVRNPAYLSARTFSQVLVDVLVPDVARTKCLSDVRSAVAALPRDATLRRSLAALLNTATDLPTFQAGVEKWYDEQMDRIGAAYTRWARRWCVVIALGLAGVFGVDAIAIGTKLYTDPVMRQTVVAMATADGAAGLCATTSTLEERTTCVDAELTRLGANAIPFGWGDENRPSTLVGWLSKLVGIVLTAFAARMGAPFWFNAIVRLKGLTNSQTQPPR